MQSKSKRELEPFQVMQTEHGKIILNKFDELFPLWGVGSQIMRRGYYDMPEINLTKLILIQHKQLFGDGVVAIDCGANIGVHTVEWAKLMTNWGHVYSFEAQEFIYYALCGSVVLNNCFNVSAKHMAVGKIDGIIKVPKLNYSTNSSFGSVELEKKQNNEWIGQEINYEDNYDVSVKCLDSLQFDRVDLIKVDVEGMEEDVFYGATQTISKYKPTIYFEHSKSDKTKLHNFLLEKGYNIQYKGNNALAIHNTVPVDINISDFEV